MRADGLYRSEKKKGKRVGWILVKEGKLWLPASLIHPLHWLTGNGAVSVDGKLFVKASDILEILPHMRKELEAFAAKQDTVI